MIDATDNEKDNRTGSGETDSGKSGGKSGGTGGAGGGIRLPPNQLKEVTANWEYLDATKVAARVAEFFSELPARASAHVQVSWANVRNQGFTIVTQLLKYGHEVSALLHNLTRE
ncbi:MAG TPA: hypothetical protein VFR09_05200, partial [Alphaproteobacteria bacterium]|nr:hypothetical protein [Alphaproteobacteria bacterium]